MSQKFAITAVIVAFVVLMTLVESKPASSTTENPSVRCKLPEIKGHCRAILRRWSYDSSTGKCHRFNFGGCDGNENNFETQKACMKTCGGI